MNIKNNLRKVDSILQLDENIFEGKDAEMYMELQRSRGLVNYAF